MNETFHALISIDSALERAARIAIMDSLKVAPGEQVLIITNPMEDVSKISQALYDATLEAQGKPVLLFQPVKTQLDFAEKAVLAAFGSLPEVVISMSAEKLGKDQKGIATPYEAGGIRWDHIFHVQLYGEKTCRSFWSPSTTLQSFIRTVPIDYYILKRRCGAIKTILDDAVEVQVTAPGGTDVVIGLRNRAGKSDDGDFSLPGSGGNLPAGETFISPENGTARGTIAFDGSISLYDRTILIQNPIVCTVKGGYITNIEGKEEAEALRHTIRLAQKNARDYERDGKLPKGSGEIYARNAENIGELGIGLNPMATVTGNMLEDEKAFHTCHFAVGHNYDEDAPALIHLDGLVHRPTIIACMADGSERIIEKDGELQGDIAAGKEV